MSIISASNTINTAFTVTGDTTGNLVFTTGGANTVALTLSNTQAATFSGNVTANSVVSTGTVNALNTFGFENRIINGAMTIDQRNGGSVVTPADATYTLDRWLARQSTASKFSVQQTSTVPTGFKNSLLVTSLSAYSVGTSDFFEIDQRIEGLNIADLEWGTANAKTITLSFWVRSSLTGTFGGSLRNSDSSRSYPFSYTISSANTWEYETITIAGDTSGTWLTTNGIGLQVCIGLGAGSTVSGTAGSWAAAFYASATGATSVVGTNGATFYITGVQLEVGSQATSFDFRDYGREFILCQRYFEKDTSGAYIWSGYGNSGAYQYLAIPFQVAKRTSPTITGTTFVNGFNTPVLGQVIGINTFRSYAIGTADGNGTYWGLNSWNASAEL